MVKSDRKSILGTGNSTTEKALGNEGAKLFGEQ